VDSHNATYSSLNGVLYDKLQTTLIEYPGQKSGSFTIPSSVTSIGTYAFSDCLFLTSVTIPASVTSIGDYAFLYCFGLTSITVDSLNANFCSSDGVLFNKNQTTLIEYPAGKSGSFTIPSSVTSIGVSAFDSCDSLTGINIPSSVTSIGSHAFYDCVTLTTISVNSANPSYSSVNGMLFDKNQTTVIQCPGGMTGSVTIPFGVTSIDSEAFSFCQGLTNVTIPATVSSIGDFAFYNCASLRSITIPASVTSIGQAAFTECQDLLSVYFLGNSPPIGYGVFELNQSPPFVFYFNDKIGFPWPTWIVHNRMVNMGNSTPVATWLLSNNLPYNANLLSGSNVYGVNLLMAYALNLDPKQNLRSSMPKPVIAGNQMSLTFYAGSAGVTYSVQSSTDLQTWSTTGVTLSDPDANNFRTATVSQNGPKKFLRIVANY